MNTFSATGKEAKANKSRKSYGRSKLGCLVCRQRRVKCDETRPNCLKCIKQSLTCSYGAVDPDKEWQRKIVTFHASATPSPEPKLSSNAFMYDSDESAASTDDLEHDAMEIVKAQPPIIYATPSISLNGNGFASTDALLYLHFTNSSTYNLVGAQEIWATEGVQMAFHNDFLMHAMLMIGASHLQRLDPASQEMYAAQSARHLNHTLRSFRVALSDTTNMANNIDAFIATALLLLIHAVNTPTFDPSTRVIDSLLPQASGVFDVVRHVPGFFRHSVFNPVCTPRLLPPLTPATGPALDLLIMVKTCSDHISEANERVYIAVIESFTMILDTITSSFYLGGTPPDPLLLYLCTWVCFLPSPFISLVNKYDPQALVIMAHYYAAVIVVLSGAKNGWWWFQERPGYMIANIATFLGPEWGLWMNWPVLVLNGTENIHEDLMIENSEKIGYEEGRTTTPSLGILGEVQLHFGRIKIEE